MGAERKDYDKAKSEKDHCFWGLYVHICKISTLYQAYQDAKANHGSPERDGTTFDCIEECGVMKYFEEISKEMSVGGNPVEAKRMMAYYETREKKVHAIANDITVTR